MKNCIAFLFAFFIFATLAHSQSNRKQFNNFFASGVKNYEAGNFDQAIVDFSNALEKDSKSVAALTNRGLSYHYKAVNQQIDLIDKAIADFTVAIDLAPGSANVWIYRSISFTQKRIFDKALNDANEGIRLAPSAAYGFSIRASIYTLMQEHAKALSDLSQVIRISPSDILALVNRGDLYYALGEFDKAIKDAREAIRLDVDAQYKEFSYLNMITYYCRKLDFRTAQDLYLEYTQVKQFLFLEGYARFYKPYIIAAIQDIPAKDYKNALAKLDTAIVIYNADIEKVGGNKNEYVAILVLKGYVLEQLAKYDEAIDVYNQALVVNNIQSDIKEALQRLDKKILVKQNSDEDPPQIEILSPQSTRGFEIVTAKSEVQIIGRAKDASGIKGVTVNGIKARTEEDGLFFCAVPLKAGENEITITASDKQGNLGSNKFMLTGKLISSKTAEANNDITPVVNTETTQKYFAIIIAAREYTDPSIQDLENPVQDAAELKSILEKNYTFDAKNIKTLYNKNKDDIMQTIIQTGNALTENDNLLIFYAGHGIAEKDRFGDVDGYWIPSSAKKGLTSTYISADDIKKALKRSNARHILVVADACFSGAFTRGMSSDASVAIQKQYSVPSRKVMASGNLEPVPDNSKFIYYLKKNLKENKEKYLTAKKLFDGFYEAILNNSDTSPQYAAIKNVGDEGGEFVFIKK